MKTWLKCRVRKGQYQDERIVDFKDAYGRKVSGFFPSHLVGKNKLLVDCTGEVPEYNVVCVRSKVEGGGKGFIQGAGVWVSKTQLVFE